MTKAFCPGHITCFFSPVRTDDVMTTGSLGAGIRLDKGVNVTLEERRDKRMEATINGKECDAAISKDTVRSLAPGRGFDMTIECELPISQGMGTSAAGAIAAGLCVTEMLGTEEHDAYVAAHIAEVRNGGGLGDVAGIMGGRQAVRVRAGIQPHGRVIDTGIGMNITVAVLGDKMMTKDVLSDPASMERIKAEGVRCVNEYMNSQTEKMLYRLSSGFTDSSGLATKEVRHALSLLRKNHAASMCMLGNSIFTNASEQQARKLLGDHVDILSLSTGGGPRVIRKA
ncbi:MAG: pantothenate kinase [Methanomassiliicoccaceae archaeon]|jgi:pantoate kinase|nr:pantothenate kinase [Methanomassiliicoccaceae archaeon]